MMDSKTKKTFKVVFATIFIDLLAFTLILPLLPKILDHYSKNDVSGAYKFYNDNVKRIQNLINIPESHNQVLLAGLLGSWFSLLQFISSPFFGALSDKFGRKPVLLTALTGTTVSYMIWLASSNSFALFVLSRTIGGLCKANVGLSLAIISDISDEKTRGKGMAVVGASFSLAFITGPLLGAYLSAISKHDQLIFTPSLIATTLAMIDLLTVAYTLKETNPTKIEPSKKIKHVNDDTFSKAMHFVNPKSLFMFDLVRGAGSRETAILRNSGFIYFYYLLFYSGLEFTLTFLTHIRFNFTSVQQGKLYLFSGILMTIIQGGYIRRIKPGSEALITLVGLVTIIPSFLLMGFSTSVGQIYGSLALYSFSSAVVVPCLTTIVSAQSPPTERGAVMGTFRSIGSLARALGPFLASFIFWSCGPTVCYCFGSIALLIPLSSMLNLKSKLKLVNEPIAKKQIKLIDPAKAS